jgi:prophage antirepressor-like protein
MNNPITPFLFGESTIRTEIHTDEIRFIAADVAAVLGHSNIRSILSRMPDDEKGVTVCYTPGGNQEVAYVTEPGLYRLIFRSNLPAAEDFRRWVFHEVLPAIRRKGFYGHRTEQMLSLMRELMAMGGTFKEASILTRGEFPPLTRKEQRLLELEQANGAGVSDPDGELFLSVMKPGVQHRLRDFFTCIPAGHRILTIKSVKGRDTAIGSVMQRLVETGRVRRVNARHATFELAENNIVSLER